MTYKSILLFVKSRTIRALSSQFTLSLLHTILLASERLYETKTTFHSRPYRCIDSGYGGLTILSKIREALPEYDYIYLGDNARAPYGTRSFEVVYEFTLQAVTKLFEMGCHLVILACNTASAKALRNIQMNDLPRLDPMRRVLGVIRPTVECIGT